MKKSKRLADWMISFFFAESSYSAIEKIEIGFNAKSNSCVLSKKVKMPTNAVTQKQLKKQFDLLFEYFGVQIKYDIGYNKTYWYLALIEGHAYIPKWIDVSIDDKECIVSINDINAFFFRCNEMLERYLAWCIANKYRCDNNLILPNRESLNAIINWKFIKVFRRKDLNHMKYKQMNCRLQLCDYVNDRYGSNIITNNDAAIIEGYLDGHNCRLELDNRNNLVLVDTDCSEIEEITFKELIVKLMQWNSEISENMEGYSQEKVQQLAEDYCNLENIFDRL